MVLHYIMVMYMKIKTLILLLIFGFIGKAQNLDWLLLSTYSITFDSAFSVSGQMVYPYYADFKRDDGSKLYVLNWSDQYVYQYTNSIPWITGNTVTTYSNKRFSLGVKDAQNTAFKLTSDADTLFSVGMGNDKIYSYSNSTPVDIGNMSYITSLSIGSQATIPLGIETNLTGTKVLILDNATDSIFQYTLPTGWNLLNGSYDYISLYVGNQDTHPVGLAYCLNGTELHIIGTATDKEYIYNCPTPYNISGAYYSGSAYSSFAIEQDTSAVSIHFKTDWNKMWIPGYQHSSIYQYSILR